MTNQNVELKIFAEALLDINRLKIIGELARGNGSVSVLAQRVNMPTDTVISHLEILSKSGVVTLEKQDDSEMTYLLNEAALKEMSKRQLNRARSLQTKEPDFRQIGDQFTADEKKYIRSFTDSNGVIKHLPSLKKHTKLLALLKYAMQDLKPGIIYSEKGFNEAVSKYTGDAASVRRELVDWGFVDRKSDGSAYWLKESEND